MSGWFGCAVLTSMANPRVWPVVSGSANRPGSLAWSIACVAHERFEPGVMIERLVGRPIDPEPYLRYLAGKNASLATA